MKTLEMVEGCEIHLSNSRFQTELILWEVYDFDVTLRMDFLSKYDANIDYRRKIMTIRKLKEGWVKFQGNGNLKVGKMILVIKAVKLLSQGAHGFIAYAQLKKEKVPKLNEVQVVQ